MWYKLIEIFEWFGEMKERYQLVKDFNLASKNAFISGDALTLLEVKIVNGDRSYKHEFSKFFGSGLRLKALAGRPLKRDELIDIAKVILGNEQLVRKLIALGWDTLEAHDNVGFNGIKYALKQHANIGGYLNS